MAMFSTRYRGRNNVCGEKIKRIRNSFRPYLSQTGLAAKLRLAGFDCDRHVIRRIENGTRFVTDIEILYLAKALKISVRTLLEESPHDAEAHWT